MVFEKTGFVNSFSAHGIHLLSLANPEMFPSSQVKEEAAFVTDLEIPPLPTALSFGFPLWKILPFCR
jgi:hypothetical protein